jgi:hypothetical protein
LSPPFGSWNDKVIGIAKQADYEGMFTSSLRSRKIDNQLYLLGRIPIRDTFSMRQVAKVV